MDGNVKCLNKIVLGKYKSECRKDKNTHTPTERERERERGGEESKRGQFKR